MQCIRLVRGDRIDKLITIEREDGEQYLLREGEELRFQVRKYAHGQIFIDKVLTEADVDGNIKLTVLPEETRTMGFGEYRFDVRLYRNGLEIYTVIEDSPFMVDKNITEVE